MPETVQPDATIAAGGDLGAAPFPGRRSQGPVRSAEELPAPGADAGPPLVTAVVVAHDGARWLPECLAGLAAQTLAPQRVVAVDTGSTDGSAALLAERLGDQAVVCLPRDTSLGAAVAAGIEAFTGAPAPAGGVTAPVEWIWLIHDDCVPDPNALAALLARADGSPSTWVVGPKVRDWTDSRLVEVGVSVDRVGHRETWLEGRELDQGQADQRTDALAVGTAGLLVRREAWDRVGGLDDLGWPYADDIDLGWRVRAAGGQVALAPAAVIRHAVAGRAPDGTRRRGAVRRNRAMRVVLANSHGVAALVVWLRVVLGAGPRALGWFLVRRPAVAGDELLAAAGVVTGAGQIRAARAERRRRRTVPARELRGALAGIDDRLRHVVDAVRGSTGPGRRRSAGAETGPVDESAESLLVDDAATLRHLLTRPGVAVVLAMVVVAVVADRGIFSTQLAGGRLLPSPLGASDLWAGYLAAWHPAGVGTAAAAPPGLAVLALLASILLGHAPLAVALVMLAAVPLATLTAWHAGRVVTDQVAPRLWAAAAWGVLPVLTGAIADGRIDVCVAAVLLPVVGRVMVTALRRISEAETAGGWSRCIGTGLLLGVVAGFAPVLWPLVVLAAAAAVLAAGGRGLLRRFAGIAVVAGVAFVVCLPWSVWVIAHPAAMVSGFGLPDLDRLAPLPTGEVLLLHPGGSAQPPLWTGAAVLLVAVAGLFRSTRVVRSSWAVLLVGLAGTLVVSRVHGVDAGVTASRVWPGLPMLVAAAGALAAALAAAHHAPQSLARRAFGIAQPAAVAVAVLAVDAVGWAVRGAGRPLTTRPSGAAPIFVADALIGRTAPRALVVRGGDPVRIALSRDSFGLDLATGATVGAPAGGSEHAATSALQRAVDDLLAGRRSAVTELTNFGIGYLVVERGATRAVLRGASTIGGFDATRTNGVVVLRSPAAAGELAITRPGASGVQPLPAAADGSAHVQLAAAGAPRRLLLAEPADGHWRATLDGAPLAAARSGWQQTFAVPPGRSGPLEVSYSDPARTAWLIVELVALVGFVLLALPFWRLDQQDDHADLADVPVSREPTGARA